MSDRGWGAWCPGWVGASHGICQRPTLQCTRWCTRWWQVDDSSTENTSVFCFQLVKPQTQVNFSHLWLTKDIFFFDIFGSRNQFWSCSSVNPNPINPMFGLKYLWKKLSLEMIDKVGWKCNISKLMPGIWGTFFPPVMLGGKFGATWRCGIWYLGRMRRAGNQ